MTDKPDTSLEALRELFESVDRHWSTQNGREHTTWVVRACGVLRAIAAEKAAYAQAIADLTRERDEWQERARQRCYEMDKYTRRAWDAEADAAAMRRAARIIHDNVSMIEEYAALLRSSFSSTAGAALLARMEMMRVALDSLVKYYRWLSTHSGMEHPTQESLLAKCEAALVDQPADVSVPDFKISPETRRDIDAMRQDNARGLENVGKIVAGEKPSARHAIAQALMDDQERRFEHEEQKP